ncbi:MAG: hypothetical protein K5898_08840 [Ruminococcus sp.]|nr:hypothetical protein [Ruminococcus sp.]MCR4795256.1 hypothetical protein [Ruminococcus sp.]
MQYINIICELRNTSLTVSIADIENATALGSIVTSKGRSAFFPIHEYTKATDTPIPAPRYIRSNAPNGFPKAHNPKKNAAAVKAREDKKLPKARENAESPAFADIKY